MYEQPAYKTFTIPNEPKRREIMVPSFDDAVTRHLYVCPSCHNTDHPPGARFCYVCGLGFPLSMQPKSGN